MNNNVLIIAAHPDDEILGCGGTIARLIDEGHYVYTMILGEGITSRDEKRNELARSDEIANLKKQIIKANSVLGVIEVFTCNFPDNRFDSVDLLDIVKEIEKIKNKVKPEIIFTHYKNDLNIDHQITNQAVLTAARPLKDEFVKEIYAFEVLSSTEWNYPLTFSPNTFYDITDYIDKKLEAMKCYTSEIREYPHPRSLEGIKIKSQQRGLEVGCKHAEAFILQRKCL